MFGVRHLSSLVLVLMGRLSRSRSDSQGSSTSLRGFAPHRTLRSGRRAEWRGWDGTGMSPSPDVTSSRNVSLNVSDAKESPVKRRLNEKTLHGFSYGCLRSHSRSCLYSKVCRCEHGLWFAIVMVALDDSMRVCVSLRALRMARFL